MINPVGKFCGCTSFPSLCLSQIRRQFTPRHASRDLFAIEVKCQNWPVLAFRLTLKKEKNWNKNITRSNNLFIILLIFPLLIVPFSPFNFKLPYFSSFESDLSLPDIYAFFQENVSPADYSLLKYERKRNAYLTLPFIIEVMQISWYLHTCDLRSMNLQFQTSQRCGSGLIYGAGGVISFMSFIEVS